MKENREIQNKFQSLHKRMDKILQYSFISAVSYEVVVTY